MSQPGGIGARAIAVVLAVAGAIVAAGWFLDGVGISGSRRSEAHRPLTTLNGRVVFPTLSPDGQTLVYGWNGAKDADGQFNLYRQRLDTGRVDGGQPLHADPPVQLTHSPADAVSSTWSPDGRFIAFARTSQQDSGVFVMAASGGPERKLADATFLSESFMQLSWSPDGRRVAWSAVSANTPSMIHLASPEGTDERILPNPAQCVDAGAPAISPDGRRLAFICMSAVAVYRIGLIEMAALPRSTEAAMVSPTTQHSPAPAQHVPPADNAHLFATLQGSPRGLAWSQNGRELVVANDTGHGGELIRLTLEGQGARIVNSQTPAGTGVGLSRGRLIYTRERHLVDIWRLDLTAPSAPLSRLMRAGAGQPAPTYSPDGTQLAYESQQAGHSQLWVSDSGGARAVMLTEFNSQRVGTPSWCSDGRRLAFAADSGGVSAVYVINMPDGKPRRLDTPQDKLQQPVWSQDCDWLIANNGRDGLYRLAVQGGPAELLTDRQAGRTAISGPTVIFDVLGNQGLQLMSKPATGGSDASLRNMPTLRFSDSWAATEHGIYFTRTDRRPAVLQYYDLVAQSIREVRELPGLLAPGGAPAMAVSPDGRWLLLARPTEGWTDLVVMPSS